MTHHYLHSTDSYELKDIEFSRIMHLQELVNKTPVLWKSGYYLYAKDIPAWSLHRLWELTPKVIFTKPSLYLTMCEDSVFYCAEGNNEEYEKSFSRQISLYDNIIDCIESLIKEGYFNKEYLEIKE